MGVRRQRDGLTPSRHTTRHTASYGTFFETVPRLTPPVAECTGGVLVTAQSVSYKTPRLAGTVRIPSGHLAGPPRYRRKMSSPSRRREMDVMKLCAAPA